MKGIIIFSLGAAVGGSAAAFFVRRQMIKKYERTDKEVQELREYIDYLRSQDENGEMAENLNYMEVQPEPEEEPKQRRPSPDYSKFYSRYESKEEKAGVEEEKAGLEHPEEEEDEDEDDYDSDYELEKAVKMLNQSSKRAEEIEPGDYDSNPYYDKESLYLYKNGVLVNDNDEIIDDVAAYLGDVLEKSGFLTNEDDVIFVRNYALATDYEIGKVDEEYTVE